MRRPPTRLVRSPCTGRRCSESPARKVATANAGQSQAPRNRQRRRRHDTADEPRAHSALRERPPVKYRSAQERRSGDPVPASSGPSGDPAEATSEGEGEVATATTRPARSARDRLVDADRVALLRYMLLMRAVEERAITLYRQGRVPGSFYDGYGQEAVSVGAAFAMAAVDRLCVLHRDLGAHLVR